MAIKIFRLVPWWDLLHRPKRTSCQRQRAPQRLCQLQLFCLNHSGPIVLKLRILWGTKLAAGTWNPAAKAPLPKVWQRNTNFSNIFPWLFELQPLSHFKMLHPQHWKNLHNHCVGRAEDVPRGLVWKREIFVEMFWNISIIFTKPRIINARQVRCNIHHIIFFLGNVQRCQRWCPRIFK